MTVGIRLYPANVRECKNGCDKIIVIRFSEKKEDK